jgi:tRNA-2-methylthio-N6-dimethylallyladenosine synthase
VLVAEGEGRKDGATRRMSGRARDNRLVHFRPAGTAPRPGDLVTTVVTRAAPHHLIADGAPPAVRRTAGGDAWQARRDAADNTGQDPLAGAAAPAGPGHPAPATAGPVLLGMPSRPRAAHTG